MGGGLAFLNKKTWHPGSFRNQEEVWKREQKAEAEERKLEELRKQLVDERKKEEFSQIAHDAGISRCGLRSLFDVSNDTNGIVDGLFAGHAQTCSVNLQQQR